jgi:hypothetical protein
MSGFKVIIPLQVSNILYQNDNFNFVSTEKAMEVIFHKTTSQSKSLSTQVSNLLDNDINYLDQINALYDLSEISNFDYNIDFKKLTDIDINKNLYIFSGIIYSLNHFFKKGLTNREISDKLCKGEKALFIGGLSLSFQLNIVRIPSNFLLLITGEINDISVFEKLEKYAPTNSAALIYKLLMTDHNMYPELINEQLLAYLQLDIKDYPTIISLNRIGKNLRLLCSNTLEAEQIMQTLQKKKVVSKVCLLKVNNEGIVIA